MRDLKELTSRYNRICQQNVRAGTVAVAGPGEGHVPSIENIVNVAQLLEINALLRAENTNLIQSQHLIRMISKEQEKQTAESP